jgi:hypothetical protein
MYRILFSRMILDGIAEFNFFAGKFSHFQQFLKHTILLQAFFNDVQKKSPFSENKTITSKVSFTNTI